MSKDKCRHENAIDIGTCSEGCCDKYDCPNCGIILLEVAD